MKKNRTFKIKDDVDLSELKDFGFEYTDNLWVVHINITKWDFLGVEYLCVNPDTRIINYLKKPTFDNDLWYCIEYLGIDDLVNIYYDNNFELNAFYKHDNVNHPNHYQGKNECIDVMVAMFGKEAVKHFCMCNAYKYRFRADKKNGKEDKLKAEWYESKLIELCSAS